MHNKQVDKIKNMQKFMESNIMINEFICEDYKNAITTTENNVIIKRSKSFIEDGKEHERMYIDNGGKCMLLIEFIEDKSTSPIKINNTSIWSGTEEALTADYKLLADTINKSDGEKKEQLQSLLEKLNNENTLIYMKYNVFKDA